MSNESAMMMFVLILALQICVAGMGPIWAGVVIPVLCGSVVGVTVLGYHQAFGAWPLRMDQARRSARGGSAAGVDGSPALEEPGPNPGGSWPGEAGGVGIREGAAGREIFRLPFSKNFLSSWNL